MEQRTFNISQSHLHAAGSQPSLHCICDTIFETGRKKRIRKCAVTDRSNTLWRGFLLWFSSNWLTPLSYQLYRYIDPPKSCRFFSSSSLRNFRHHHFFYCNIFIIIFSSTASLYHWRSTSSPEENNFIHWLHLILHSTVERVCRGATSFIFLSADSNSTD